jgi:hypothetical protein
MKKLIAAAMIAAFGSAVILPAIGSFDSAYAATKKKKKTARSRQRNSRRRKTCERAGRPEPPGLVRGGGQLPPGPAAPRPIIHPVLFRRPSMRKLLLAGAVVTAWCCLLPAVPSRAATVLGTVTGVTQRRAASGSYYTSGVRVQQYARRMDTAAPRPGRLHGARTHGCVPEWASAEWDGAEGAAGSSQDAERVGPRRAWCRAVPPAGARLRQTRSDRATTRTPRRPVQAKPQRCPLGKTWLA